MAEKILTIVGPTASGKTSLAIDLANSLCDFAAAFPATKAPVLILETECIVFYLSDLKLNKST